MTTMDWVLYFGVPVCALILYFLYQAYKNKQNNLRKLRSAFGKKADKKYIYEEFENISHGFFCRMTMMVMSLMISHGMTSIWMLYISRWTAPRPHLDRRHCTVC